MLSPVHKVIPFFVFFAILFLVLADDGCFADEVTFSQEVIAYDLSGNRLPAMRILPDKMGGMTRYSYELGRERQLVVETNVSDAAERGLAELVETVRRCYDFVQEVTGLPVTRDILLYLVELDYIPRYYSFEAKYPKDNRWGEVRLALLRKGDRLAGGAGRIPMNLAELLYDTIPHELGHDVLGELDSLPHDLNNRPSFHTRWFIEGVCEIVAKRFAGREAPNLAGHFLSKRNIDTVLADPFIQNQIFFWSQENDNSLCHESDLYGAAMLVVMKWTEYTSLQELLEVIGSQRNSCNGDQLVSMMENMTGYGQASILQHAFRIGLEITSRGMPGKRAAGEKFLKSAQRAS